MKTIFAAVSIDRAAAVLAGRREFGAHTVPVNPELLTERQRETLVRQKTIPSLDDAYDLTRAPVVLAGVDYEKTVPMVLDAIDAAEREKAEQTRQRQIGLARESIAGVIEWLAIPDSDLIVRQFPSAPRHVVKGVSLLYIKEGIELTGNQEWADLLEKVEARRTRLHEEAQRLTAEAEAEQEERTRETRLRYEQEKREEEEAERRKEKQISDWIEVHGTKNQQKRAAAKLLPEKEVIDAMRDYAFEPLANYKRFSKLSATEVVEVVGKESEYPEEVSFSAVKADEATDGEYEAMETLLAAMRKTQPIATAELIEHRGWTPKSDDVHFVRSVKMTVPFGEFTFTREYKAPLELIKQEG